MSIAGLASKALAKPKVSRELGVVFRKDRGLTPSAAGVLALIRSAPPGRQRRSAPASASGQPPASAWNPVSLTTRDHIAISAST